MYPAVFFFWLIYAVTLAGYTAVPGFAALALAFATSRVARPHGGWRTSVMGCLWVVHELSRRLAVLLVSASCGLVGAGLASFGYMVSLVVFLWVYDLIKPEAELPNDTLVGELLFGVMLIAFLCFFCLAMMVLAWALEPKREGRSLVLPERVDQ